MTGTEQADAEESLLREIVDRYLSSGDFNGLFIGWHDLSNDRAVALEALVRRGEVELVGESDFVNPHIRPWPVRRSLAEQVNDVRLIASGDESIAVCAYPTRKALASRLDLAAYGGALFTRRMAEGSGSLELTFFSFDVLES